jgi:hypothetical protein
LGQKIEREEENEGEEEQKSQARARNVEALKWGEALN